MTWAIHAEDFPLMVPDATVTDAEVQRAVRAQLGPDATVEQWTVDELGRGRGDATTSLGVCRISGSVRIGGATIEWSQVRKVFVPPPEVAGVDMGRSPGHWNYWRREPALLASDLLTGLPGGVAAPRAYLVEGTDDAATVWTEDLGHVGGTRWSRRELDRVAYGLGLLGGWYAGRAPDEPWLSRNLLHQWVRDLPALAAPLLGPDAPGWSHPVARDVFPAGAAGPVAQLLAVAKATLPAAGDSPMTLCHRDAGLDNLLLRSGGELVLFDWALAGPGPVGEDLGVLIASVARTPAAGVDHVATCRELVAPYLAGARVRAGVDLDPDAVWRTAVVTAALREGIFAAFHISRGIETPDAGAAIRAGLAEHSAIIEALAAAALTAAAQRQRASS
jgi:Phosphotransferase enzyme family